MIYKYRIYIGKYTQNKLIYYKQTLEKINIFNNKQCRV